MGRRDTMLTAGLGVLVAAWGPWAHNHGTLAGHMLQHLVVMNLGALLFAAALRPRLDSVLAGATVLQVVLLWGWHLPVVLDVARHDLALTVLMQGSLFLVAFLFWGAILAHPVERSWQTIFATLVTAKAVCLFGAILCFARGSLYAAHGAPGSSVMSVLDDQQLAGLLMMASCALIYVTAAVTLFVQWMNHLGRISADRPQRWNVNWSGVDG